MAILQPTITNISATDPQPIIGKVLVSDQKINDKFYSAKLLNYVESIEIDGVLKTVFFSELNTNVNVGDRVFIVNGFYDSDLFINQNKYRKFSDGYRVLAVNGCRVVLDVEYTGQLPYIKRESSDYIFVHYVDNQKDFDYANSITTILDGSTTFKSIFSGRTNGAIVDLECQNILFATKAFNASTTPGDPYGGVDAPGFWVRADDGVNNLWENVTDKVLSNSIGQNRQFSESGNLYIKYGDVSYNNLTLKKDNVYKYENFGWVIDINHYVPYLTKNNFRFGKFTGTQNDGVFGQYLKRNFWDGGDWNSGVFINSDWISGNIESKHTVDELSYNCRLETVGGGVQTVIQTLDTTDNLGFGYSIFEDSTFFSYTIKNGNFKRCVFRPNSTFNSALDIYYGFSNQHDNVKNGGRYELCNIKDVRSNYTYYLNSEIENVNLKYSRVVSSEVVNSSLWNGEWSNDGGIKILGADLYSFDKLEGSNFKTGGDIWGTIKLFISEDDYFRIRNNQTFHISNLNKEVIFSKLTDSQKMLFNIENKYFLDNFDDYDFINGQKSFIRVSLSSTSENNWKYYVGTSSNVIEYRDYVIAEDDDNYWYTIPSSSFKGQYDNGLDLNGYYKLNDFVYNNNRFYKYVPYNRAFTGGISRAQNESQAELFVTGFLGDGINGVSGKSDWIWVGIFVGEWSINGLYYGFYQDESQLPYFSPRYPDGNVVGDAPTISDSTKFWIFVGQKENIGSGSGYSGIGLANLEIIIEQDIPSQTTNAYYYKVVDKDLFSKNTVVQSDFNLPSINITSRLFGYYLDDINKVKFSLNNKISPISPENINKLFIGTVLGLSDFKSGLMDNSRWLGGDNSNYALNSIQTNISGYNILMDTYIQPGTSLSKNIMKVFLKPNYLDRIYDINGYDYKVGNYVWIKSLMYDYSGSKLSLSGVYRVVGYFRQSDQIWIQPVDSNHPFYSYPLGGNFVLEAGQTNNYFSIHKFNITNSQISSGKFMRTGIDNSTFENKMFVKYKYPNVDFKNNQLIRIVNMVIQQLNNNYKSGTIYKSHAYNSPIDGATFYDSIWYNGTFVDGLFKESVWNDGTFDNGKFVDSRNISPSTLDYDTSNQNYKMWKQGTFNKGEFYNSFWASGTFNSGRFHYSDWMGGSWNNGILGNKKFKPSETTMSFLTNKTPFDAKITYWKNGIVENATVGGEGVVEWYNGKFLGGEFTSKDRNTGNYATWFDGQFYGGSFTKQAWWKTGTFYGGKFLSEIGWRSANFLTHSNNSIDYGWVGGEFLGGEFGNGSTGTNSIWYDGVMEGGIFRGRFWRTGLMTSGKFYGSFNIQSETSEALKEFKQSFYGLWNDGNVNNIIYDIKSDRLVTTNETQANPRVTKFTSKNVEMNRIVWRTGTFSHELSKIENSVWLDGNFVNGNFNNSVFNPFVDLQLGLLTENDYNTFYLKLQPLNVEIGLLMANNPSLLRSNPSIYLSQLISAVFSYNAQNLTNFALSFYVRNSIIGAELGSVIDFTQYQYSDRSVSNVDSLVNNNYHQTYIVISDPTVPLFTVDYIGISIFNYPINTLGIRSNFIGKYYYPVTQTGNPYSFNLSQKCVWTNGNFNGGEFNYSKWLSGKFNDGTMNGVIWKNGTFNYGFMNNSLWENGIWRNGTWNGSPFDYNSLDSTSSGRIIKKRTIQMVQNIYNNTGVSKMHINNLIVNKTPQLTTNLHNLGSSGVSINAFNFDANSNGVNWIYFTSIPLYNLTTLSRTAWRSSSVNNFASKFLYMLDASSSRDIFIDSKKSYLVNFSLYAYKSPSQNLTYIDVEIRVGSLDVVTKRLKFVPEFQNFSFIYQPTSLDLESENGKSVWIKRVTSGELYIVSSSVKSSEYGYDSTNNSIVNVNNFNGLNPTISLVSSQVLLSVGSPTGDVLSIKFGNGAFKKGIWKTGVWNDGWRSVWQNGEEDILYFDSINIGTFQKNANLWYLKIDSTTNQLNLNNIQSSIKINDYISLSNVVGININEDRSLLIDYYRVTQIDINGVVVTLTIEVPVGKFPIRRFEKDSNIHLIYVTKNIWLGGTFLNGYFRGIWNYGLFKGYPLLTIMNESHFVSGKFDGGRFISRESSYVNDLQEIVPYNTGLIQYFDFFDNNISEKETFGDSFENKYQSWIDVNYYTQSFVNINSLTSIYDDNFGKEVPLPNLYGYPTNDVISSFSKFKNATDDGIQYYNLGTKYRIYSDQLGEKGYFRKAFNSEGPPYITEFTRNGWTANTGNFYGTPTVSFVYNSNIVRKNFNKISIILATFGYNVLNNFNINIDERKYTVVEYDLDYFQRGFDFDTGEYTNTFRKPLNLLGSNYPSANNIFKSGIVKTEYFYNKNALDLILRYNSEYLPPNRALSIHGFNYTYSNSTGESDGSYSTTYSIIMPTASSSYQLVDLWEAGIAYDKGDVRRRPSNSDASGFFYISLQDNNTEDTRNVDYWAETTIGFNSQNRESTILEQSANFDFYTSVRINYFKFLEIDNLPFFKYFDFEINFFSTINDNNRLGLEFLKPHGLVVGDIVTLQLDETKFNPQYEGTWSVIRAVDGFNPSTGDLIYTVRLDVPYGFTVSYLSESGTVKKVETNGDPLDRIDRRVRTNFVATSPRVEGLDETFVYLGNNQILVDRNYFD